MSIAASGATEEDGAAPSSGFRHAVRALGQRDFAIFWTAALVSNSGAWLQNVTVPYVLYSLTGSTLWIGLATFAQFMPVVLCGPFGGNLADRYDRRKVLIRTQLAMATVAASIWLYWVSGGRSPTLILGFVALSGAVSGLNVPSWQAFVPSLVPRSHLLSAITLNSLQFNAARAIGPALAGLLLARFGPAASFWLNALSFGCVVGALLLIRPKHAPRSHPQTEPLGAIRAFIQAMNYVRGQPGIRLAIQIALMLAFLGNPIVQIIVVFARDVYQVSEVAFGLLTAALGIGAAIAAPLVSGWDEVLQRSMIVRYAFPVYGLAIASFGFSTDYPVGFISLVIVGAGFLSVISATNTAVQLIVADRYRGRVMAARVMAFTLAYAFGGLVQGFVASHIGPRATVTTSGLVLCASALALSLRRGRLELLDTAVG